MTSSKWNHQNNYILIGYTTTEHLLLDLDFTSFYKATKLVQLLQYNYPELGNALIVNSSRGQKEHGTRIDSNGIPRHYYRKDSFHVIFNNAIGYSRCCHIINTLVDLQLQPVGLKRARAFRGDMTLRVSPMVLSDRIKKAPTPWRTIPNPYYGKQDGMIKQYLAFLHATNNLFKG